MWKWMGRRGEGGRTCVCEVFVVVVLEEGAVVRGIGLLEEGLVFDYFELDHFGGYGLRD